MIVSSLIVIIFTWRYCYRQVELVGLHSIQNHNAVGHGYRDIVKILRPPHSKSHRVTIPYIMIENKVLNKYPFSKAKRGHDKIRKLFASGNVIIIYMTSLLF